MRVSSDRRMTSAARSAASTWFDRSRAGVLNLQRWSLFEARISPIHETEIALSRPRVERSGLASSRKINNQRVPRVCEEGSLTTAQPLSSTTRPDGHRPLQLHRIFDAGDDGLYATAEDAEIMSKPFAANARHFDSLAIFCIRGRDAVLAVCCRFAFADVDYGSLTDIRFRELVSIAVKNLLANNFRSEPLENRLRFELTIVNR